MPSLLRLALVFLASLLIFSIYLFPASLVVSRLDGVPIAGAPLQLKAVSGRLWEGQVQWQWRKLSGSALWQLDWHGLTPGVNLDVRGGIGLSAWVGGTGSSLTVEGGELTLSGASMSQVEPRLRLAGEVAARELAVEFRDKAITDASGQLSYTGGQASGSSQASVDVPALRGLISRTEQGASLEVSTLSDQRLAHGEIKGNVGEFTVLRAWAAELGLSRGGNLDDAIFQTSLPLWSKD